MYGLNDPKGDHPLSIGPAPFGRQCLIARRLVERGVRFVQIYSGGGHQQQNWDAHNGIEENLKIHCPEIDKPVAALLTDLEHRGLLEETLVVFGGEFGRQPVSQGAPAAATTTPRASPTGWPAAASKAAPATARPTNSATRPSSTATTSATCTPPSCT